MNDEEGGGGSTAASLVGAARVFCFFLAASPVFVISYKIIFINKNEGGKKRIRDG